MAAVPVAHAARRVHPGGEAEAAALVQDSPGAGFTLRIQLEAGPTEEERSPLIRCAFSSPWICDAFCCCHLH